ncbi:hypothetical protein KF840_01415 [bacterium]|nr:hypothetical protein [bacterium]
MKGSRARASTSPPARWVLGLAALATLLAACAVRPAPRGSAVDQPFILTFWCAPPLPVLDDARMAEIAAAGFTTLGAPCEGDLEPAENLRMLALAERHGLRAWVADHRLYSAAAGAADGSALTAAVVDTYRAAPALAGYVVADEPITSQFPRLAPVVAALRAADPARLAYINLLPDYVPPPLLEAESYPDYLERFVAEVRPRMLSVDYYPFGKHKDRSTFFANLAALRETALRHDLPFLWIALAMPHGPYRAPSEGELSWQAFHALAYGARGVSYFTYWTPSGESDWHHRRGLLDAGRPTARYFQVQRINRQLRAAGDALAGWRSLAVADSRGEVAAPLPIGPLAGVDGGDFTIGFFGDGDGIAALVVNRDYRDGATATLRLRPGVAPPLELVDGRWQPARSLSWVIEPGGARLLKWAS